MTDARYTFADHASQHTVRIFENQQLAKSTYRLRFACPSIAGRITPGQFLMVRLADCDDPLIGRALALYDTVDDPAGEPDAIDVVYLVGGKLTSRLAACQTGQALVVWGPLGNGFPPQPTDHLIMVAGGIGQTPFVALGREHLGHRVYGQRRVDTVGQVTLCYGARSSDYLAGLADFEAAGVTVRISTDDGSSGYHGLVTGDLERLLHETAGQRRRIVCCGPEPMMEAVAAVGDRHQVPVQVSLETPMACGIGICFSCVAPVVDADGNCDYRRTCVEGPVFDAQQIRWDGWENA